MAASLNGIVEQNPCFLDFSITLSKVSIYWKMFEIHSTRYNVLLFANSFQPYCASYLRCRFNNRCLGYIDYFKAKKILFTMFTVPLIEVVFNEGESSAYA